MHSLPIPLELTIDRSLAIPLAAQLRGQIEYGIVYGKIARGSRLPPVRELAAQLDISLVTVAHVYKGLQQKGLITSSPGKGSYVAGHADIDRLLTLHQLVEGTLHTLKRKAQELGLDEHDLHQALEHKIHVLGGPHQIKIYFVGIFPEVSQLYVEDIKRQIDIDLYIDVTTLKEMQNSPNLARDIEKSDLIITFQHREQEIRQLLNAVVPIVSIQFIPSKSTRMSLAALEPDVRLALVTIFPEFLPVLKVGVEAFAVHVTQIRASALGLPDLDELLRWADVVVYASGLESLVTSLSEQTRRIEYLHTPDPASVQSTLLPILQQLIAESVIAQGRS